MIGNHRRDRRAKLAVPALAALAAATLTAAALLTATAGAQLRGAQATAATAAAPAGGDIPDNQVFLTSANAKLGFSMKYPEGWAQRVAGNVVSFHDKDSEVRVTLLGGPRPTPASAGRDLARLAGAKVVAPPRAVTVHGAPALEAGYTKLGAADPVTGKRLSLIVDRYYLWHGNRVAVVDLATPKGVDNVDAFRLMIQSFRWK